MQCGHSPTAGEKKNCPEIFFNYRGSNKSLTLPSWPVTFEGSTESVVSKVLASKVATGYIDQLVLMAGSELIILTPVHHPSHSESNHNISAMSRFIYYFSQALSGSIRSGHTIICIYLKIHTIEQQLSLDLVTDKTYSF